MTVNCVHIRASGGIGDFIYFYFKKPQWKLLTPVKKAHPDVETLAILTCHASAARELIELHPAIDAVLTHDWYPPGHKKEYMWKKLVVTQDIKQFAKQGKINPQDNPQVYLSKTEKEILKKLQDDKPFVVIHPFAGLPHRGCRPHPKDGKYKCFPDYKYAEVIQQLAQEDINVIVLGKSERGHKGLRNIDEMLDVSGKNIHNFIDQISLRLSVALTRAANGFIGTHSSMLSAAWTNKVPSVYFYPTRDEHGNKRSVMKNGGETGSWAYHEKWTHGFELTPVEFQALKPGLVIGRLKELMKCK